MLRPTFYSFETAKRALSSSQMGLDTVGHNISNVNTPGYTRQRVDQVTFNLGGYHSQFTSYGYHFPGQGAEISGINQIRDPYLDRRFRTEAAKVGELSTTSDGLAKINRIFDEIQKTGSHAKMGEFLTELDALIAGADSPEQATVLKSKAEDLARVLNKNSIDLENAATMQQEEMLSSVNSINVLLQQIADLNVTIKEDNFYGNPSNENNDLRNLYLDQLSELLDVEITRTPVEITPDFFVENIKLSIRGSKPEAVLVDGGQYNAVEAQFTNPLKPNKDPDRYEYLDTVSYRLVDGMTKLPIKFEGRPNGDVTADIMTGVLKGHLDILNGKSINAKPGENTFRGLPYTQQALDDYAKTLADVMNKLNAIQVWDPSMDANGDGTIEGGFQSIARDLFVPSGNTGDVTEFTHMGQVSVDPPTSPPTYLPGITVVATKTDGTNVDATQWRSIDAATGNILGPDGQPILDGGGVALNVKDFERKLTARNIAVSDAWRNDPLHITREQKNNALAVNAAGELMLAGDPPTTSGVKLGKGPGEVASIGALGTLLDVDGNQIMLPGQKPLTLDLLQRVITEVTDAPVTFADYFAGGVIGTDVEFKMAYNLLDETAFTKKTAGTGAIGPMTDWTVDEDGYLLDAAGDRVYLNSDAEKKDAKIADFVQQSAKLTTKPIPPDFADYFPGGKVAEPLTFDTGTVDADGKPVYEYHYPEDFISSNPPPAVSPPYNTYDSFNGWSISGGNLLDAKGNVVSLVSNANKNQLELQVAEDDISVPAIVSDYVDSMGNLAFTDGSVHGAGDFGPGVYSDFDDWQIFSDGSIRDADGKNVFLTSTITAPDPTKLEQQHFRAAPADINNFLNGGTMLVQKTAQAAGSAPVLYGAGDFVYEDGTTVAEPFGDWKIDGDGYLTDSAGKRLALRLDPNTKVKATDLVQQFSPKLQIGENTPNDLLPGEKANGNLDQMKIALGDKGRIFPNGFKGNFQEYFVGFQEDMANDKQTTDSILSGSVNVLTGLANDRDGISAVSIDEEGISMMTYQNYYNAASRYMTTLDEALDKIINGMGTVGR